MNDHLTRSTGAPPSRGRFAAQPQECRECHVICERVVSPWRCLRDRQSCIYAYVDGVSTYIGCLHKVFLPELDLAVLMQKDGEGIKSDPYGKVRVFGAPRPQCSVSIERAYNFESADSGCLNPAFLRDSFRVGRDLEAGHHEVSADAGGIGF